MNRPIVVLVALGVAAVATVAYLFTLIFGPGGDGIVAETSLPDGRRFAVIQRWNASMEPYTVSFVYQLVNGQWGWCYMDHEDTRWLSGKVVHNPAEDSIDVYRGKLLEARLHLGENHFELFGSISRTVDAPQSITTAPD